MTVSIKSRVVTVKGPRGTLTKSLRHVTMDLKVYSEKREVHLVVWFGNKEMIACVRTVMAHIQNMITGVTKVCTAKYILCVVGQFFVLCLLWVMCCNNVGNVGLRV